MTTLSDLGLDLDPGPPAGDPWSNEAYSLITKTIFLKGFELFNISSMYLEGIKQNEQALKPSVWTI